MTKMILSAALMHGLGHQPGAWRARRGPASDYVSPDMYAAIARKAEQAEGLQQQLAVREVEFQQLKAEKGALRQRFVALHAQAERLSSEREALKQQVRTLICLYHQGCQQ